MYVLNLSQICVSVELYRIKGKYNQKSEILTRVCTLVRSTVLVLTLMILFLTFKDCPRLIESRELRQTETLS